MYLHGATSLCYAASLCFTVDAGLGFAFVFFFFSC
jgi:hypothetical protein